MEEECGCGSFGFAFNDPDFSDRVLHIQIIPDQLSSTSESEKLNCAEFQLKSLHLSSPILAAKSRFFYKLFKNGMAESQQKEAILRTDSSEEKALTDLLRFMYTNTLSATTFSDLVDVLMAADKFEVESCIKRCIQLLSKMPMSLESALLYLHLPSTVLAAKPLIDASKEYLVSQFNDLDKSIEEALELPLDALEVVLGSESLRVYSEDNVYKFILEWAQSHYPKLEERQEILNKQLLKFISFPHMSCSMLREALVCPDFNSEQVPKLVMEALFGKAEVSSEYFTTTKTRRLYDSRFVKVVPVEFSLPRFVIYFNLKKEDCVTLLPKEDIWTEVALARHQLYFGATCRNLRGSLSQQLSIYINVDTWSESWSKACALTLDIELAVMKKTSNQYQVQNKERDVILPQPDEDDDWNLLDIPWKTFISDESEYFVDGILHVRAELTITKSVV